ncbi:MAG: tryptophan synthase subunit alpha [candidate division Zixibacteria bacterium]
MKSLTETFANCRRYSRKALMPFLTAGYPDERTFLKLLFEFQSSGADMVEIGIPFSDPLADGKTIQYSSHRALQQGINVVSIFRRLSQLNGSFRLPLIMMSYFNPIYHYGVDKFISRASSIGIKGLIIPDIIPEESGDLEYQCRQNNIDLIYLLAPTSNAKRTKLILRRSRGFVYLVTIAGVTGARDKLPADLVQWIKKIKKQSDIPVCSGFGISHKNQAATVSRVADGVIVGSAIIDIIRNSANPAQAVDETGKFIRQLRKGIDYVKG